MPGPKKRAVKRTDAQRAAENKYKKAKQKKIQCNFFPPDYDLYEFARNREESMSSYLKRLIREDREKVRTARNEAGARFPNFHLGARDAKGILVKIVNLACPGCGARLEVDMDRKMAFCSYCGAALPIDDEIQKVQLDGAEKAGYEFEKGRQRAQAEAAQASFPPQQVCYQPASQPTTFQPQVPPQPQQAPQEPPKRRKTWLWVLG